MTTRCELCGKPMPPGEEMFKYHGYSGPCPVPVPGQPPPEPPCPEGRRPHRERVADIDRMLKEGQTGGIAIDDTPEHRAWYLHELTKYSRLTVEFQGVLSPGVYVIKVRAAQPAPEPSPGLPWNARGNSEGI